MDERRAARVLITACAVSALLSACSGADEATPAAGAAPADATVPTLYWVDVTANTVHRATGPDFQDAEVVVTGTDPTPDGIAVDVAGGKLYWTSMGLSWDVDSQETTAGGGTLQRADLDGTDVERILEPGTTLVPKQLQVDPQHGHLYWADREGAKLWRAGLDGADPEVLVSEHGNVELVGVALDVPRGHVYFSDRIAKKIFRAGLQLPAGQTAADRTDIELLVELPGAAMPAELDVDREHGFLYWTDRFLGTVQRAGLDLPTGQAPSAREDVETLVDGLNEPIGLSLDVPNDRMYYGVLSGAISEATLDGEQQRRVARATSATGVELVHVPGS